MCLRLIAETDARSVGDNHPSCYYRHQSQVLHHLQFCKVLLAATSQLLHMQTKGVAVMQVVCHALHTASVVLMTSAQISTRNL